MKIIVSVAKICNLWRWDEYDVCNFMHERM